MSERLAIYVFRGGPFGHDANACVAPVDLVVGVFGGGGLKDSAGLSATFGGVAYFRNDETGAAYLGVWGARKASKFRSALRQVDANLEIVHRRPPARLIFFETKPGKPSRRSRRRRIGVAK